MKNNSPTLRITLTSISVIISLFSLEARASECRPDPYVRPFGDRAPWNIPAIDLPSHADSRHLVRLLWEDSTVPYNGNFNLTFDQYTYPVYYAACATEEVRVMIASPSDLSGHEVPWNRSWRPASGSDAQVIILDQATGREWDLWQAKLNGDVLNASNGSLVAGSYWTNETGWGPSRGAGIPYYAMLVQPESLRLGTIRHALSMPIKNTDGKTFVPPATKLEHPGRPEGIPAGTRFVLTVTDEEIDAWINTLPDSFEDSTRRSARIIAEALRTYGWFVTDTSGSAHLQFEDRITAGELWDEVGLAPTTIAGKEYPRDLLDGLVQPDRIRATVASDWYAME
ncbi:MAG: hypothetical protein H6905_05545 [Hyphomicrobiales bacterium]|nr:hypothetical protein [Hyphomicrobiales bacterium]